MVFCALASFDATAQPPDDDAILTIDTGRLVAMLDQVATLMKLPEVEQPPSQNPTEVLDFVVKRYRTLLHVACERTIVEGPRCGEAYAPYLQPEPVSLPVLRREVDGHAADIRSDGWIGRRHACRHLCGASCR